MSSVNKSDRREAEPQFLATARELEMYTIQKCVGVIPKRYTFFLANHLADSAHAIYGNVKRGNSIYPLNQHEVQMRRDYFLRAYAELQNLTSEIEVAYELLKFDMKVLEEWAGLISTEMRLVKGVLDKDRERYKKIQP